MSILHAWTDPKLQRLLPHRNTPPRLIVAIEDERDGPTAVRLKLAQWTFAAVPGHPVLLDLIQHVAKVSHYVSRSLKDGTGAYWMSDEFVMEWTGPKIFTEAVYRYLRAQWGFNFRRLKQVNHPVRVGDVLILPPRSFQADAAELRGGDLRYSYVWHGFVVKYLSVTADFASLTGVQIQRIQDVENPYIVRHLIKTLLDI